MIAPLARKLLRTFGIISAVYVLYIFAIDGSLNFLWGVLLVGVGLISLFLYTKSKRRYYTPLILTIFYFLGFLLSFTDILINKENMPVTGFTAIGTFGFTDAEFFPVVLVICTGMAGIMAATFFAEKIFENIIKFKASIIKFKVKKIDTVPEMKKGALTSWIWIWFLFSVFVLMLMWYLGLGRTGLKNATILPFKLAGLLFFIKQIVIPFGGLFLLGLLINSDKKGLTKLVLWMLIFVGALGSIAGISRGYFVFTVFPAFLYMFLTSYKSDWKRKILFRYTIVAFILVLALIVLVEGLRAVGYAGGDISISGYSKIFELLSNFDPLYSISIFLSLLTTRVGGMRELLATSSSSVTDLYAPWALFITDVPYIEGLLFQIFGFLPASNDTLAFGVAFGFWSMLALSGSYIVVFLGTIISCLIVMFVEEIFIRKNANSVACFFSLILGMFIWGGIYLFFLVRYALIIFLCYVLMNIILKTVYRRNAPVVQKD